MGNYSNKVTKPLDTSSMDAEIERMKRIAAGEEPAAVKPHRPQPVSKVVFDELLEERERGSDEH